MSCKTLKLKNCEIKGATFQGRRFDFVNKVITNDTFKAKVYNSEGVLKTEITGLKSGSVVYFPFTTLETYDKGNYTIRYWAEFHLLGKFNIADEDFKIANSCPNCTTQNQPYPFILDLGEDIVKFNMSFVYIQIGSGGDTDLTAYLTKEEAADTYQPKGNYASANHNHSDKANTDASNISEENTVLWRKKLNVPQIPDSVISIGAVTADSSTVYLGLPLTGKNEVLIDGQTYERTDPQSFPFTPVTTGEKILIIHALPDSQVFHLVQGAESTEAVEPVYGGLFVARILVTTEGINIEEATAGFKEKANDGWRYITLADNDPKIIEVTASPSHSFNLQPLTIANEPKIVGIKSVGDKNTWDGNELLFFIDGDSEVTFVAGAYDEGLNYVTYAFAQTVIGKPYTYMRFKRKNWYYHHIPAGGGASFPEGTDGEILELDSTAPDGVKWVDKIKGVASGFLHYWNGSTWLSSGVEFISVGIIKVKSIILTTNSGTALPDELGYDGTNVFFGNTKRKLRYNDSTVFTYTPTGNFTISQIRTAMEAAGYVFNDCHINVQLGSNNYTCTIDIGASHPYRIFTMDRNGTGSISFLSTRTLNSGVDAITIMNGNEFSRAIIKTGTSVDFLKIRNE